MGIMDSAVNGMVSRLMAAGFSPEESTCLAQTAYLKENKRILGIPLAVLGRQETTWAINQTLDLLGPYPMGVEAHRQRIILWETVFGRGSWREPVDYAEIYPLDQHSATRPSSQQATLPEPTRSSEVQSSGPPPLSAGVETAASSAAAGEHRFHLDTADEDNLEDDFNLDEDYDFSEVNDEDDEAATKYVGALRYGAGGVLSQLTRDSLIAATTLTVLKNVIADGYSVEEESITVDCKDLESAWKHGLMYEPSLSADSTNRWVCAVRVRAVRAFEPQAATT